MHGQTIYVVYMFMVNRYSMLLCKAILHDPVPHLFTTRSDSGCINNRATCQNPYSFRQHVPLTTNVDRFSVSGPHYIDFHRSARTHIHMHIITSHCIILSTWDNRGLNYSCEMLSSLKNCTETQHYKKLLRAIHILTQIY